MKRDAQDKINRAIKACLCEAYEADLPLAKVAAFLNRLREDADFDDAEVETVHAGVRRMLTMIYKRAEDGEIRPLCEPEDLPSSMPARESSAQPLPQPESRQNNLQRGLG